LKIKHFKGDNSAVDVDDLAVGLDEVDRVRGTLDPLIDLILSELFLDTHSLESGVLEIETLGDRFYFETLSLLYGNFDCHSVLTEYLKRLG
jgi:hypothetical protein